MDRPLRRVPESPLEREPGSGRSMAALALLPSLAAIAALLLLHYGDVLVSGEQTAESGKEQVYPATLVAELNSPAGDEWLLPAAAVPAADGLYVLDSGHNRILHLDPHGRLLGQFEPVWGGRPLLRMPMALASDGKRLFIANSGGSEVVVLGLDGAVQDILPLPRLRPEDRETRPIGIAIAKDGGLVVSDANNSRVLFLDAAGQVRTAAGTGSRADGSEGFNVPAGLAVDGPGNVYVVDTLNGRVVQLSADGAFIRQFGKRGGSAGSLARPKAVAVDQAGRVFVSDGILAAVVVFAPDGSYLGALGRRDPGDPASELALQSPAGLALQGGELYVADRYAGVVVFQLETTQAP